MKKLVLVLAMCAAACAPRDPEVARWEAQAANITIIRDEWGIPHVYGRTDADAVFGVIYAQAEDDFRRVETNYLNAMGRLAEAEGESEIWRDLRMKLFIDPDSLKAHYEASPEWLKALMNAWADGLNYYLHTHPEVTPRVITRYEPWMALSFTEGSIGGDIERVNLRALERFYGDSGREMAFAEIEREVALTASAAEPTGSNGIALAPSVTATGHAMLLINPHTSFYFRAEAHMASDEGLNAYGAITWGQFFIYQGFNERAGWMHTSSGVDNIDEFAETIVRKPEGLFYRYGKEDRPVTVSTITVPFKTDSGMAQREFTVYRTHHGPVVRAENGKWITVSLMQDPVDALTQSYTRTKATGLASFRETMELHTNSSNNTVYADAEGNIAYWHANFVPKRDPRFDYRRPVDGSNPATDWQEVHSIDESPNSINPPNGWVQNTNNWPYSAAGANSPKESDYPAYMDRAGENARGMHAMLLLEGRKGFTLDSLIATAFDTYLPPFAELIPPLLSSYDRLPAGNPLKARVAEQIELLRGWDYRWAVNSVPTSLALFWADTLQDMVASAASQAGMSAHDFAVRRATATQRLEALAAASAKLEADFGSWRTPWGDINRYQRITPDITPRFDDSAPSFPVGFPSGRWGSLASFGARPYPNTKKWYGTSGNSFVAVVEFGDSVEARAVMAGGQSGHQDSPHFADQIERYATGNLRPVHFYRPDVERAARRTYRPGR
ncbi:MAG TPA: penicillin acylase family protein [Gemmatimonadaceae bacterium]